jgi:hypothetical protein
MKNTRLYQVIKTSTWLNKRHKKNRLAEVNPVSGCVARTGVEPVTSGL